MEPLPSCSLQFWQGSAARASSYLLHLPPGTRRKDGRSSRRALQGCAGPGRSACAPGRQPGQRARAAGPELPPALAPPDDRLWQAPTRGAESPPEKSQLGAYCSTRPSAPAAEACSRGVRALGRAAGRALIGWSVPGLPLWGACAEPQDAA